MLRRHCGRSEVRGLSALVLVAYSAIVEGHDWGDRDGHVSSRAGFSPVSISTIGEDLTITGNVTSKGELHLNGQVHGDVHCVALVLGENAQVEGNVVAEDVMVRGRLIGSVRALNVMLQATAHVEGDLFHKSFCSIEQGTHFEGESRPSDAPLSVPEIPRQNHGKTTTGPKS